MSARTIRRVCAVGFVCACVLLTLIDLSDAILASEAASPIWLRYAVCAVVMALASATAAAFMTAVVGRTLRWTRESIARIEAREAGAR